MRQSGFMLLDKQPGISSAQAIAQLRRKLNIEKIGHAGTLDPMATGLLVILLNRATRLADAVSGGKKIYSGTILFGIETSTDDVTGETIRESDVIPDVSVVRDKTPAFLGTITQYPPTVSAVNIDGERAYERARKGEIFETRPRQVTVDRFEIAEERAGLVSFTVECSKGTYIRSLARDLGRACGSAATLASLRREASAPFSIAQAKTVDQIMSADLISWDTLFVDLPRVTVSSEVQQRMKGGDERALVSIVAATPEVVTAGRFVYVREDDGESLGLCEQKEGRWRFAGTFLE